MKIKVNPVKLFVVCITIMSFLFISASVWEGAAAIDPGSILPSNGLYAATNSFPRNTVVDIINLENNRTVRVIVAGGLETPGLLALVSREVADAIGISDFSTGRIRMIQPSDPIAFSRFTNGYADEAYDNPAYTDYEPVEVEYDEIAMAEPVVNNSPDTPAASGYGLARVADEYNYYEAADPGLYNAYIIPEETSETAETESELDEDLPLVADAVSDPDFYEAGDDYEYSLVPDIERPPVLPSIYEIDPEHIIPGITSSIDHDYESNVIVPPVEHSSLTSIPVISRLEHGSYYVQIGAYGRIETIESEINRIDSYYPLAVFNAGSDTNPLYRILLGPLNHGESGAMLRRFRSIGYRDAFIRQGN